MALTDDVCDEDPRWLSPLELLKAVQLALNMVPRHRLRDDKFRDTYELAAEVDRHVQWAEENKEESDL